MPSDGASTVRQIHAILSGALGAAERWDWIASNPARIARRPKQKPPEPDPPTPAEAAKLVEEAFSMDDDWDVLVWLAMTTGMRRGELLGLRFARLDLDAEVIDLRRNWVGGKEKDTKTHQNRRIALDTETVVLLKEHRQRAKGRLSELDSPKQWIRPPRAGERNASVAGPVENCHQRRRMLAGEQFNEDVAARTRLAPAALLK